MYTQMKRFSQSWNETDRRKTKSRCQIYTIKSITETAKQKQKRCTVSCVNCNKMYFVHFCPLLFCPLHYFLCFGPIQYMYVCRLRLSMSELGQSQTVKSLPSENEPSLSTVPFCEQRRRPVKTIRTMVATIY